MRVTLFNNKRARQVYVCGQLVYSVGMVLMALTQSKWGVLVFSWSAGIMYSTLFTMPYILVAHYHENDMVRTQRKNVERAARTQPLI
jgi:Na+/melibiose symporter-like transporter